MEEQRLAQLPVTRHHTLYWSIVIILGTIGYAVTLVIRGDSHETVRSLRADTTAGFVLVCGWMIHGIRYRQWRYWRLWLSVVLFVGMIPLLYVLWFMKWS
jgi:hypothetical protein